MPVIDFSSTGEESTSSNTGNNVLFDEEGFFIHPETWTEALAETMAVDMGIPRLTGQHWALILFLHNFYMDNGRAPLNREIKRAMGLSILDMENLFPGGIRRGARRIAGLPNPKSC